MNTPTKRALITGITGQDGSYLAELLAAKNYEIHGFARRGSKPLPGVHVTYHYGDLTDPAAIRLAIEQSEPEEVYHLGAQSHVKASFEQPHYTFESTGLSTHFLLEAVKKVVPRARVYQAASSEMFGIARAPQSETTPLHPRSPYAIAKVFAFHSARLHREAYSIFAANGILFNHESERRPETFVTRKITRAVGRIKHGLQTELHLGNLAARRDWGFAGDYVEAMWRMLQQDAPNDFVVATGETHSVSEFVELAFAHAGLDWKKHVRYDARLERPAEVPDLCGDASRARAMLGWEPKVRFPQLVARMVEHDLRVAEIEAINNR